MTCGALRMNTRVPRLKRRVGKSVTMRHLTSPRIPWADSTCATTRNSGGPALSELALDDVEVDADAFFCRGGFDERAEPTDDASLAADDLADVLFVDLELVDRGIAILDLVDLDGVRLIDEGARDV